MTTSGPTTGNRTRLWGAAGLLAAGLVLAPALVIGGAALEGLPGRARLERLEAGTALPPAGIETAIAAQRRALAYGDDGRRHLALGLLHMARADAVPPERAGRHLRMAARALRRGLARAPAHPGAWARLALARYRLDRSPVSVLRALRMSLRTGPWLRPLAPARAELTLRLWPLALAHIDRRTLAAQMRLAWDVAPAFMRAAARASGRAEVLRRAVEADGHRAPSVRAPAGQALSPRRSGPRR